MPSSSQKLPISVAMVVYNSEKVIRRALLSCADLVDEIIIVHDGECTDKTLEIAKEFTDKIFVVPAAGAPEPHRPFSFAQAKNNWILQFDDDEYLGEDFRAALPELIKKDVAGYKVHWIEEQDGKQYFNMVKEVLFQKDRVFFIGAPSEYIKPVKPGDDLVTVPVSLINSATVSNYNSWKDYTRKYRKFITIQAKIYTSDFSTVTAWNYSGKTWDRNTALKINHPILLGIIGMNVKYLIELAKNTVGIKIDTTPAAIYHLMWYNTVLYWDVFRENKRI